MTSNERPLPPRPRRAMVQLTTQEMEFVTNLALSRSASVSSVLRSLLLTSPRLRRWIKAREKKPELEGAKV